MRDFPFHYYFNTQYLNKKINSIFSEEWSASMESTFEALLEENEVNLDYLDASFHCCSQYRWSSFKHIFRGMVGEKLSAKCGGIKAPFLKSENYPNK